MKSPKVLLTGAEWYGDLLAFCERGLLEIGAEVRVIATNRFDWSESAVRHRQRLGRMPIVGAKVEWHLQQKHKQRLVAEVRQQVVKTVKEWQPDLILSILCWNEPITENLLSDLAGIPVIKAAWLMDDPFQHDGNLAALSVGYDLVYAIDGSWIEPLRLLTKSPVTELLCGVDLQSQHSVSPAAIPAKFRCGVAFVGSSYRGNIVGKMRNRLLQQVADLGLHIYGDQGWASECADLAQCYRGGELSSNEANLAYNGADIALNIHHPQFRVGTSLRTFAICGAGAFQLVDWRPGLDRFLIPNEEIVAYRTPDELRELSLYYLADAEARRRIARAGYERVRHEHTYAHRLAQMLRDADLLPSIAKINTSQVIVKAHL